MAALAQSRALGEFNFNFASDFLSDAVSSAPAAASSGGSVFSLSSVIDNLKQQAPAVINSLVNKGVQKLTAAPTVSLPAASRPAATTATPANVQTMAPATGSKPTVAGVPLPLALGGAAALGFLALKAGGRRGRAR